MWKETYNGWGRKKLVPCPLLNFESGVCGGSMAKESQKTRV